MKTKIKQKIEQEVPLVRPPLTPTVGLMGFQTNVIQCHTQLGCWCGGSSIKLEAAAGSFSKMFLLSHMLAGICSFPIEPTDVLTFMFDSSGLWVPPPSFQQWRFSSTASCLKSRATSCKGVCDTFVSSSRRRNCLSQSTFRNTDWNLSIPFSRPLRCPPGSELPPHAGQLGWPPLADCHWQDQRHPAVFCLRCSSSAAARLLSDPWTLCCSALCRKFPTDPSALLLGDLFYSRLSVSGVSKDLTHSALLELFNILHSNISSNISKVRNGGSNAILPFLSHWTSWTVTKLFPPAVPGSPADSEDSLSVRGGAPPSGRGWTISSDLTRAVLIGELLQFFSLISSL